MITLSYDESEIVIRDENTDIVNILEYRRASSEQFTRELSRLLLTLGIQNRIVQTPEDFSNPPDFPDFLEEEDDEYIEDQTQMRIEEIEGQLEFLDEEIGYYADLANDRTLRPMEQQELEQYQLERRELEQELDRLRGFL